MAISLSRCLRFTCAAAALALAAPAGAAPPPGMRWGDHSGLHPSVGRSSPSTTYSARSMTPGTASWPSARTVYPSYGPGTTYYYSPAPRIVYPSYGPVVSPQYRFLRPHR